MNPDILTSEVQQYLQQHELTAPADMALRKSPFATISSLELARQLDGRQRCRKKLPLWHDTSGIYYPEKLAVEQASSQTTASYKADLLSGQARVADLTGGFGVDAFFFAERAKEVVHCERNPILSEIAQHNAKILGANNITFVSSDGIAYLQSQPDDAFDCLYVDPSRRVDRRKVFRLEDCEPDVVENRHLLLQKASKVFIKSAPLLDITAALQALGTVSEVHIISVDNECKELLFVLERGYRGAPRYLATVLRDNRAHTFTFRADEERRAVAAFGKAERYLFEPDAALLKSGAFKLIAQRYGLKKLHRHTHLYTSTEANADFLGRTFTVDDVLLYADFKRAKTSMQANVSTRNFPLKAADIRKRHRIREGGDRYLFFCTGPKDMLLVIFASKC